MGPISAKAQDIAAAHASLSLLTALVRLLVGKKVISLEDANRITAETSMVLSSGGPINQLAAQILQQMVPSLPQSSKAKN